MNGQRLHDLLKQPRLGRKILMPAERGGQLRAEAHVGPRCIHHMIKVVVQVAVFCFAAARQKLAKKTISRFSNLRQRMPQAVVAHAASAVPAKHPPETELSLAACRNGRGWFKISLHEKSRQSS